MIPNFAVVKDNLSKNIVAYLGDYKPFLDKTKEKVEKELGSEKTNNKILTNEKVELKKKVTIVENLHTYDWCFR